MANSIETQGDITVGRNASVGGKMIVQGNAEVSHNLNVKGWLDAPNIKDKNKGIYGSSAALNTAYPNPEAGWFAGVTSGEGESWYVELYMPVNGVWTAQEEEYPIKTDLALVEAMQGDVGGLKETAYLTDVDEVNDFLADIVLKRGVEIDFDEYESITIRCLYLNPLTNQYENGIYLGPAGSGINLIWNKYDTLDEAKAGLGVLLTKDDGYCYVVLRDIGTYNETIEKTITFNRDISWSSLNEHPVIKALLMEQHKVTAFSVTPSNENYPSEKLVNDTLKTPLDAIVETKQTTSSNVYVLSEHGVQEGKSINRGNGSNLNTGCMTGSIPVKPNTYYYLSNRISDTAQRAAIRCEVKNGDTHVSYVKVKNRYGQTSPNRYVIPADNPSIFTANGQFLVPSIESGYSIYLQINLADTDTATDRDKQIMLEEVGSAYNPAFEPKPYEEGSSSVVTGYKIKSSALDYDDNLTPGSQKPVSGGTVHDAVVRLINEKVTSKTLKILDLGNSYTIDATHYLGKILEAANISTKFSLYGVHRSGSSFRSWVNLYKEADSNATYKIWKIAGDNINSITNNSTHSGTDREWFVELLKHDWDIILIHQASTHSAKYDEWAGAGDAGGLPEYLRILRTYCPKAAIGFYIIHSYASWARNQSNPSEYAYAQGAYTSEERWQNIASAVEKLNANYNIDFIIPYGTAVQNLRKTSLNNDDPVDSEKKNDFSYDAQHLSDGIGDYVAACAYFEALFAPLFNVTVLGNSYTETDIPDMEDGQGGNYNGRGVPVQITAENALLAQRAAILAVNDMFHLNSVEDNDFVPANPETPDTPSVFPGGDIPGDLSWLKNKTRAGYYTKAEIEAMIEALQG